MYALILFLAVPSLTIADITQDSEICFQTLQTLKFQWNILNFTQRRESGKDESIYSPVFPQPTNTSIKWHLKLYPNDEKDIRVFICSEMNLDATQLTNVTLKLYKDGVLFKTVTTGESVLPYVSGEDEICTDSILQDKSTCKSTCFGKFTLTSLKDVSTYLSKDDTLSVQTEFNCVQQGPCDTTEALPESTSESANCTTDTTFLSEGHVNWNFIYSPNTPIEEYSKLFRALNRTYQYGLFLKQASLNRIEIWIDIAGDFTHNISLIIFPKDMLNTKIRLLDNKVHFAYPFYGSRQVFDYIPTNFEEDILGVNFKYHVVREREWCRYKNEKYSDGKGAGGNSINCDSTLSFKLQKLEEWYKYQSELILKYERNLKYCNDRGNILEQRLSDDQKRMMDMEYEISCQASILEDKMKTASFAYNVGTTTQEPWRGNPSPDEPPPSLSTSMLPPVSKYVERTTQEPYWKGNPSPDEPPPSLSTTILPPISNSVGTTTQFPPTKQFRYNAYIPPFRKFNPSRQ